jgi:hypothetical protein
MFLFVAEVKKLWAEVAMRLLEALEEFMGSGEKSRC